MKALLDARASVDLADDNEWTPLHWAAMADFPEVSQACWNLVGRQWNCQGNACQRVCSRTFHRAHIMLLTWQAVPLLVAAGIQVDARTNESCTALHLAAGSGFDKVQPYRAMSALLSGVLPAEYPTGWFIVVPSRPQRPCCGSGCYCRGFGCRHCGY